MRQLIFPWGNVFGRSCFASPRSSTFLHDSDAVHAQSKTTYRTIIADNYYNDEVQYRTNGRYYSSRLSLLHCEVSAGLSDSTV